MRTFLYTLIFLVAFVSCRSNSESKVIDQQVLQNQLRDLVSYGYSIEELSIRSGYSVNDLVEAYDSKAELSDSACSSIISDIWTRHKQDKIIPVNRIGITASEALWQVYTKAQNFPLVSVYSGIGIVDVCHSMTQRSNLNVTDSIRALVAYVNMKYDITAIPNKILIEDNTTYLEGIEKIAIPNDFRPELTDSQKRKVEYYLWRSEQFERKANMKLKAAIEQKVSKNTNEAVSAFIDKDVDSYIAVARNIFKDSLEKQNALRDKLKDRLALDEINQSIKDEIIAYCISVNTSRAILVNDMLGYSGTLFNLGAAEKTELIEYEADLNEANIILYNKSINAGKTAISTSTSLGITMAVAPWETAFITAASASGGPAGGATATVLMFAFEDMLFEKVDAVVDCLDVRNPELKDTKVLSDSLRQTIQHDINNSFMSKLNEQGSYYDYLQDNTTVYFSNIRQYFNIDEQ